MNHSLARAVLISLVGALVLSACQTPYTYIGAFRSADLFGVVYGHERFGLAGAEVTLEGKAAARTDQEGRFRIKRVGIGDHVVRVSKEGYLAVEREIRFLNRSQVLYVQLHSLAVAERAVARAAQDGDSARVRELSLLIIQSYPENVVARYALALGALESGDSLSALRHLSAVAVDYAGLEPLVALGRAIDAEFHSRALVP